MTKTYDPPLLFDVEKDPGEGDPISYNEMPKHDEDRAAMERILKAYAMEKATFDFGTIAQEPDGPGEGPGTYALCCDRSRDCYCKDNGGGAGGGEQLGLFNLGTKRHHDAYHEALGEEEPLPPQTPYQSMLRNQEA